MQADITLSLVKAPATGMEAWTLRYNQWTGVRTPYLESVISTLLTVKLLIVIPLILMAVFYSFQTMEATAKAVPPGSFSNKVMRVSIVAIAVFIGYVVHDFGKLFSLVAALCLPSLTFIYPIVLNAKVSKMYDANAQSWPRKLWHFVLILVALLTLTFGTYESLEAIIVSS